MDEQKENQNIIEQVKNISIVVSLLLTLSGVGISLLNFLTLNKLQPFANRLEKVESAMASQVELNKGYVSRGEVISLQTIIDGRLKSMEDKVDFIYKQAYSRLK